MTRPMKDSGIAWIGEIPFDWQIVKIKYLRNREQDSFQDGDWIESPYIVDEGIRYLTTGNIGDGVFKQQGNGYITEKTFEELNCKYAYPGDLVISRLNAPYGRACILPTENDKYVLAVDIVILRTDFNKLFLCYLMQCNGYQNVVQDGAKGTTMKRISRTNLGNVSLPIPPLNSQSRIAAYLDEKCAAIDTLIDQTHASIEEYKKLKQAVITQAVTKGIRPGRKMKDSGIEWVGDIPEEWGIAKISSIGTTCSGATPLRSNETDFFNDATIRWVRTLDLNDGLVSDTSEKITELALQNSSCNIMPVNTICVAMYGGSGTIGKCGLLTQPCATNQAVCSIVCKQDCIMPMYLLFQLQAIRQYWMIFAVGTRKDPNISQDIVKNMRTILPPLAEQQEIVAYLDEKCAAIDAMIDKKEQLASELEIYKKSLIFEYVTGKKEVTA